MYNSVKKSQYLYKNRPWLTFLVLVSLGTMVLAVCSLFLGCGSNGSPPASQKDAKAAISAKPLVKEIPPKANTNEGLQPLLLNLKPTQADAVRVIPPDMLGDFIKRGMAAKPIDRESVEVFPPGKAGGPGVTVAEFQKRGMAAKPIDRESVEVFPPGKAGGPGVTVAEFQKRGMGAKPIDRGSVEVIPPGKAGGPGVKSAEFQKRGMGAKPIDRGSVELIPPDKTGGQGIER
jgi:hypothetical protein